MILAGDIGGTHTRLALFNEGRISGGEVKFDSQKHQSLEEIIIEFLGKNKVQKACFGVAGPVREGRCKTTNIPWLIDSRQIQERLKIEKVSLLNDLEAIGYGLRVVKDEELFLIQEGKEERGNRALIAAGTGLGEAGLIWDGREHRPFACEGGHTDFAPRNEMEIELLLFLQKKYGHVSYERVLSGPGLIALFDFLIESGRETLHLEVELEMKRTDPAKVISDWGIENRDRGCKKAVEWFISLYGSEAGNLALKFLAFGGIYVGGGIAPRLAKKMKEGLFLEAFLDKGRFRDLLKTMPIWIIMNENAGLLGAAHYASLK